MRESTMVLCLLSSDPVTRGYETDLIREIDRKELPRLKVIVGHGIADEIVREGDVAIDLADDHPVSNDDLAVLGVLVGQVLALFAALHMGCAPDRPSTNGAIARIVPDFTIHPRS